MASASSARKCDRRRRVQTPASMLPKTGAAGNVSLTVALISVSPSIGTDVSRENVTKEVNKRRPSPGHLLPDGEGLAPQPGVTFLRVPTAVSESLDCPQTKVRAGSVSV